MEDDTGEEDRLMRDELTEFMRSVAFDPGDTFDLLSGEGNVGILWLDLHFDQSWLWLVYYIRAPESRVLIIN